MMLISIILITAISSLYRIMASWHLLVATSVRDGGGGSHPVLYLLLPLAPPQVDVPPVCPE
jgi:hypothetical protein